MHSSFKGLVKSEDDKPEVLSIKRAAINNLFIFIKSKKSIKLPRSYKIISYPAYTGQFEQFRLFWGTPPCYIAFIKQNRPPKYKSHLFGVCILGSMGFQIACVRTSNVFLKNFKNTSKPSPTDPKDNLPSALRVRWSNFSNALQYEVATRWPKALQRTTTLLQSTRRAEGNCAAPALKIGAGAAQFPSALRVLCRSVVVRCRALGPKDPEGFQSLCVFWSLRRLPKQPPKAPKLNCPLLRTRRKIGCSAYFGDFVGCQSNRRRLQNFIALSSLFGAGVAKENRGPQALRSTRRAIKFSLLWQRKYGEQPNFKVALQPGGRVLRRAPGCEATRFSLATPAPNFRAGAAQGLGVFNSNAITLFPKIKTLQPNGFRSDGVVLRTPIFSFGPGGKSDYFIPQNKNPPAQRVALFFIVASATIEQAKRRSSAAHPKFSFGYEVAKSPKLISEKTDSFILNAYKADIKKLTIDLASSEKIRQWAEKVLPSGKILGQVINSNTLHYKTLKPIKGGLFCDRIFGPLNNYECACGKIQRPSTKELVLNPRESSANKNSYQLLRSSTSDSPSGNFSNAPKDPAGLQLSFGPPPSRSVGVTLSPSGGKATLKFGAPAPNFKVALPPEGDKVILLKIGNGDRLRSSALQKRSDFVEGEPGGSEATEKKSTFVEGPPNWGPLNLKGLFFWRPLVGVALRPWIPNHILRDFGPKKNRLFYLQQSLQGEGWWLKQGGALQRTRGAFYNIRKGPPYLVPGGLKFGALGHLGPKFSFGSEGEGRDKKNGMAQSKGTKSPKRVFLCWGSEAIYMKGVHPKPNHPSHKFLDFEPAQDFEGPVKKFGNKVALSPTAYPPSGLQSNEGPGGLQSNEGPSQPSGSVGPGGLQSNRRRLQEEGKLRGKVVPDNNNNTNKVFNLKKQQLKKLTHFEFEMRKRENSQVHFENQVFGVREQEVGSENLLGLSRLKSDIGSVVQSTTLLLRNPKGQRANQLRSLQGRGPIFSNGPGGTREQNPREESKEEMYEVSSNNLPVLKPVILKRTFCPICDVEYTLAIFRRSQLGYIQLAAPVTHVWFVKANPSYLSLLFDVRKKDLEEVIYCSQTMTLEISLKGDQAFSIESSPKTLLTAWKKLISQSSVVGKRPPSLNFTTDTSVNNMDNSIQYGLKKGYSLINKGPLFNPEVNPHVRVARSSILDLKALKKWLGMLGVGTYFVATTLLLKENWPSPWSLRRQQSLSPGCEGPSLLCNPKGRRELQRFCKALLRRKATRWAEGPKGTTTSLRLLYRGSSHDKEESNPVGRRAEGQLSLQNVQSNPINPLGPKEERRSLLEADSPEGKEHNRRWQNIISKKALITQITRSLLLTNVLTNVFSVHTKIKYSIKKRIGVFPPHPIKGRYGQHKNNGDLTKKHVLKPAIYFFNNVNMASNKIVIKSTREQLSNRFINKLGNTKAPSYGKTNPLLRCFATRSLIRLLLETSSLLLRTRRVNWVASLAREQPPGLLGCRRRLQGPSQPGALLSNKVARRKIPGSEPGIFKAIKLFKLFKQCRVNKLRSLLGGGQIKGAGAAHTHNNFISLKGHNPTKKISISFFKTFCKKLPICYYLLLKITPTHNSQIKLFTQLFKTVWDSFYKIFLKRLILNYNSNISIFIIQQENWKKNLVSPQTPSKGTKSLKSKKELVNWDKVQFKGDVAALNIFFYSIRIKKTIVSHVKKVFKKLFFYLLCVEKPLIKAFLKHILINKINKKINLLLKLFSNKIILPLFLVLLWGSDAINIHQHKKRVPYNVLQRITTSQQSLSLSGPEGPSQPALRVAKQRGRGLLSSKQSNRRRLQGEGKVIPTDPKERSDKVILLKIGSGGNQLRSSKVSRRGLPFSSLVLNRPSALRVRSSNFKKRSFILLSNALQYVVATRWPQPLQRFCKARLRRKATCWAEGPKGTATLLQSTTPSQSDPLGQRAEGNCKPSGSVGALQRTRPPGPKLLRLLESNPEKDFVAAEGSKEKAEGPEGRRAIFLSNKVARRKIWQQGGLKPSNVLQRTAKPPEGQRAEGQISYEVSRAGAPKNPKGLQGLTIDKKKPYNVAFIASQPSTNPPGPSEQQSSPEGGSVVASQPGGLRRSFGPEGSFFRAFYSRIKRPEGFGLQIDSNRFYSRQKNCSIQLQKRYLSNLESINKQICVNNIYVFPAFHLWETENDLQLFLLYNSAQVFYTDIIIPIYSDRASQAKPLIKAQPQKQPQKHTQKHKRDLIVKIISGKKKELSIKEKDKKVLKSSNFLKLPSTSYYKVAFKPVKNSALSYGPGGRVLRSCFACSRATRRVCRAFYYIIKSPTTYYNVLQTPLICPLLGAFGGNKVFLRVALEQAKQLRARRAGATQGLRPYNVLLRITKVTPTDPEGGGQNFLRVRRSITPSFLFKKVTEGPKGIIRGPEGGLLGCEATSQPGGPNKSINISGAGLLKKIIGQLDYYELKKIDKQNRILLYEFNKKITSLKKHFNLNKAKRALLKEYLKTRNLLIRRTKFIRMMALKNSAIRPLGKNRSILHSFNLTFNLNSTSQESMVLTTLPVLPPDLRPIMKIGDQLTDSDLNKLYIKVIQRNDRLKKFLKDSVTSNSYEMKYAQRLLQEAVDNLIQNGKSGVPPETDSRGRALKSLSAVLKGKEGRFRQYLLGKRVDYSGRSVIVVGPLLKLHECGIPKEMAIELYKPFLLKRLLNHKYARTIVGAKTLINTNKGLVWQVLREIMETCPVLLNRAPTLHRLGFQAFLPKLVEGKAILLHPLVCPAFNADFDGDQMGVHIPLTLEARTEAWKLMLSRNNLLSPATGEPIVLPSQDMVLGCYYLTTNCNKSSKKNELLLKNCNAYSIINGRVQKPVLGYKGIINNNNNKSININNGFVSQTTNQRGTNKYFKQIDDVLKAYNQRKIDLHAVIWLKWQGYLESNNDLEQPLEIRLMSYGYWQEIYPTSQSTYLCTNPLLETLLHHPQRAEIKKSLHKNWPHQSTYSKNVVSMKSFNCSLINNYIRTTPGKILFNSILFRILGEQRYGL
nr:RNA polymerase beta' subunit [Palmellopsis texensis]